MALTQESSTLFKSDIPVKMKDPSSLMISYYIEGIDMGNALCDVGANINLMSLSTFKKLGIREARPTKISF